MRINPLGILTIYLLTSKWLWDIISGNDMGIREWGKDRNEESQIYVIEDNKGRPL